ncbi:undecaprenyl-diphosphate phosphatase [Candidatus Stoquefichus sp. SB1]|uniref:undecaprenyl-diphosphate phosphatase n=1 Tax=Candidatus Stoquefichus sp. SB1 TaxID=1658109 RepID=UPI00067E87FE|nr:undecaprenyl-diphosphate phosphatase [Candidatus Stoquefichus sp. SB1]
MDLLQNILVYGILGAIQGFSEPIPISSSGHLVIFKSIFQHFGWSFPTTDITFEVLVNTGSLLAIMFYYRKDIARLFMSFFSYIFKADKRDEVLPDFRYCMLLIVATIPAAIGGVLLNDYIENAFSNVKLVGCTLLVTAVFLMLIHKYGYKGNRTKRKLNLWDALRMGCFQLVALLPGISRSGSTITGGMLGGLEQKTARDFSFFMFMPVSLGAIVLKLKDFIASPTLTTLWLPYLIAFIISGVVTYLALQLLFSILNKRKMNYFSAYCLAMGLFTLIVL